MSLYQGRQKKSLIIGIAAAPFIWAGLFLQLTEDDRFTGAGWDVARGIFLVGGIAWLGFFGMRANWLLLQGRR